jgi:hypothetical protein
MATTLPVAHHLACRVRINDRWVLVDATWDQRLKRAGFPVNEYWDGWADTHCPVKPLLSAVRTAFCRTATNEPCRDRREQELNPLDGSRISGMPGTMPGITAGRPGCDQRIRSNGSKGFIGNSMRDCEGFGNTGNPPRTVLKPDQVPLTRSW